MRAEPEGRLGAQFGRVDDDVETETDARSNVTTYVYDTAGGTGNLLEIDQPIVGGFVPKTFFTYNGRGQPLTKTDPTGKVTLNAYDAGTAGATSS